MNIITIGFILFFIFIYIEIGKKAVGLYKSFKNRNNKSTKKKDEIKVNWLEKILLFFGAGILFLLFINLSTVFVFTALMIGFIGFLVYLDLLLQKRVTNTINSKIYKLVKIPLTLAFTPIFLHISFLIVYGPEATYLFGNHWQQSLYGFIILSSLITLVLIILLLFLIWEIIKAKEKIVLSIFGVIMGFAFVILFFGWTTYLAYSTLKSDVQYYEGKCAVTYYYNTTRKIAHVTHYQIRLVDVSYMDKVDISDNVAHDLRDHKICENNKKVKIFYTTPLGGALSVTYDPIE